MSMHICGKGGADRKGACPACDAWLEREAHKRRTTPVYDAGHSPAAADAQPEDKIWAIYDRLGPNAQRVLYAVAKRLDIGRQHGDFTEELVWVKEGTEEHLDFVVYEIARRLRLGTR